MLHPSRVSRLWPSAPEAFADDGEVPDAIALAESIESSQQDGIYRLEGLLAS